MTSFSWLPDAAWRGALLLSIVFVLARLLTSQPAAVRHVLWAGALGGVMAMPILPVLAPARFRIALPQPILDLAPATRTGGAGDNQAGAAHSASQGALDVATPLPAGLPSVERSGTHSPAASAAGWRASITPARVAVVVWLLGAAFLALRLLAGFVALRRLTRRADEVDDPATLALLSACAVRIGTHTTPRLLVSPAVAMPCTAGWLHPIIVLPGEYAAWDRERLEVVLLHELGHIRRMDIVPHLLGEVTRVVYWFNPLVWVAAARLRAEAEGATDDRVVRAGARPTDYAAHLLDIVIQASPAAHPAPVIPLARRSEFEGRVLAILESGGRALPRARWAAGVMVMVAGLSLGVASMGGATGPVASSTDEGAPDESAVVPEEVRGAAAPEPAPRQQTAGQGVARTSTVEALAEALRDPVASVRQAAAQALGGTRDSIAVRALMEVLRSDESAAVRRSAAWALGEIADAAAIPALADALTRDRDAEVRRNAASALGSIDNPRATPALTQALERDAEVSVRKQAAESLANIEDPGAIDALIRALDRDDDPGVRRAVIEAIDNLEGARAVPAVSRALRDDNVEVRRAAAEALGSMDDRDAVPPLMAAARDANAEMRRAVVQSLGNLGDRRAIPAFVAALSDTDVEVRRAAAQAFGNLENVRTAPPELLRAIDDRDAEVRHEVAHALGHIGDPDAVRPLIAHITDANVEVRRAVVESLDEFDDPAVVGALQTALKDQDPEVRKSAAEGLGNRSRK
jgi:HEAT repeat protein/beta-lactamase regulating signal transducer with metallopeptidase domain